MSQVIVTSNRFWKWNELEQIKLSTNMTKINSRKLESQENDRSFQNNAEFNDDLAIVLTETISKYCLIMHV